ncbi:Gfo/Idh/MocA family oxidoreductase [Micrococcales bacterium 31B]|nr:Gfo/Idh/MocA family oxidoreductase [Micrococcales bacterium 31B]
MSFKVGVVSFAHLHATSYLQTFTTVGDEYELLTCDPDAGLAHPEEQGPRGREFADQFGAAYVESFAELLAWGPDAVMVCSENTLHYQYALAALEAGAHVLSEKPLTTDAAQARELVAAAERANRMLMVAFPVRFAQEVRALQRFITAGHLGEVRSILGTNNGMMPYAVRRWFTNPDLAGGGALVDHTVHCADLIEAILGEPPSTVYAVSNGILQAEKGVQVETAGLVTITYPSGVIVTIDCSWSQPDTASTWGGLTLQVTGTKGAVGIDPFGARLEGSGLRGTGGSASALWLEYGENTDALMIDAFLRAARAWGTDAAGAALAGLPLGTSGLRTVQIVEAALESVRTGDVVTVASET